MKKETLNAVDYGLFYAYYPAAALAVGATMGKSMGQRVGYALGALVGTGLAAYALGVASLVLGGAIAPQSPGRVTQVALSAAFAIPSVVAGVAAYKLVPGKFKTAAAVLAGGVPFAFYLWQIWGGATGAISDAIDKASQGGTMAADPAAVDDAAAAADKNAKTTLMVGVPVTVLSTVAGFSMKGGNLKKLAYFAVPAAITGGVWGYFYKQKKDIETHGTSDGMPTGGSQGASSNSLPPDASISFTAPQRFQPLPNSSSGKVIMNGLNKSLMLTTGTA